MRKSIYVFLALMFASLPAHAGPPPGVQAVPGATANHCMNWAGNNYIQDCGGFPLISNNPFGANLSAPGAPTYSNTRMYDVATVSGSTTDTQDYGNYFSYTNNRAMTSGVFNNWLFGMGLGHLAQGNQRNVVIQSSLNAPFDPVSGGGGGSAHTVNSLLTIAQALVNDGGDGRQQNNWFGSIFAHNPNCSASAAATFMAAMNCQEIDVLAPTGSSFRRENGLSIVHSTGHAAAGVLNDYGLGFVDQSGVVKHWKSLIQAGSVLDASPTDSTTTLFKTVSNIYSGGASTLQFGNGFDTRDSDGTGTPWLSQGAQIGPAGDIVGASLQTRGVITAQTATVSSLTINPDDPDNTANNTGGDYAVIPLCLIQAPPSGTTATCAVATMGMAPANLISLISGTGNIGDQFQGVGGTGTEPTVTIATHRVASATVTSGGSGGTPNTSQIVTVIGGTGTAAQLIVNIGSTGAVTTGPAEQVIPNKQGSYSADPPLTNATISGGGLAGAKVSLTMAPNTYTVTTGSLSVLPTSWTCISPGGCTSTAQFSGYKVLTITAGNTGGYMSLTPPYTLAGSGYTSAPPPLVTLLPMNVVTQLYYAANVTANLTPAAATLALNPATLGTTATTGFVGIPIVAGTPTGVPSVTTGMAPMVYDTTGHHLWIYDTGSSAWTSH